MPLVKKIELEDGFIALWQLAPEDDKLFVDIKLSQSEERYLEELTSSKRRKEWLAWHFMAKFFLGEDTVAGYDKAGAPVLVNKDGCISVSHSADYVALYYSSKRCAVDIESLDRNYGAIRQRVVSPTEFRLPRRSDDRFFALIWCAKEVAYKYANKTGIDILRDIVLTEIDKDASEAKVELFGTEYLPVKYEFFDNHCMVYTK